MRKLYFMLFMAVLAMNVSAQSALRRAEQAEKAQKTNADNVTLRSQISFPTSAGMNEDVVWRRDVYRELNLNDDANAGLYYPAESSGSQMNLFTYIFKLMMVGPSHGGINVYQYRLDGNERFTDDALVKPLTFLDDHHIFYERTDRGVHIDDSDIPSSEVKGYYIKECSYYDQISATFHTKIIALCPIMERADDFGDGTTKYPLFWVKYDDLAPLLAKRTIMVSNINNAAVMSLDDYFTMNRYKGKIYKTANMQGRNLAQYCKNDTALNKEQLRIENEIVSFEKNIWGDQAKKDSLDKENSGDKKALKASRSMNRRSSGSNTAVKIRRQKQSSSSSGNARVTVRRQRH
ncbi:type IX secretion system ring subunit PorN/GldN [Segatella paludivivens]|uniref:type IX secretion system ring protein PorN/GldN n=1 Tax=Segatella paludivivens TaxID=185294 RepID=UPI00036D6A14|nr:gliding motility protein GldN [Segatella paludivivens]